MRHSTLILYKRTRDSCGGKGKKGDDDTRRLLLLLQQQQRGSCNTRERVQGGRDEGEKDEGGREEKRKDQATGDIANTWSLVLDLRVNIRGVRYSSRHRSSGKPESRFCESRIFLEKN